MKKQFITEAQRMQKLAGIVNEANNNIPQDITNYLSDMIEDFSTGNDNEYPVGKKMRFSYEEIEKGDRDIYDDEDVDMFYKTREFLKNNGPATINDKINYTYSTDGEDIHVDWVEPDWSKL